NTVMGIIIGSSSLTGGIFDFFLAKQIRSAHFRRLYLGMLAAATAYLFVMLNAHTILFFLIAMMLWGIYYDLLMFGDYNYISHESEPGQFAKRYGLLDMIRSLAFLFVPLVASLLIMEHHVSPLLFTIASVILIVVLILFVVLSMASKNHTPVGEKPLRHMSFLREFALWKKLGTTMRPVLILMFMLNVTDSFFWTVGPLLAEELAERHAAGGAIISVYFFPSLFIGFFVGAVTKRFGKKFTAVVTFICGSSLLLFFWLVSEPLALLVLVFFVAFFFSFSWPAIRATISDYISETGKLESEIEGVTDFSTNSGYVIGPLIAGILADYFGLQQAFALLGVLGVVVGLGLLSVSRKSIRLASIR
ncbi:MAG: MFS transporter, partial [Candidatus Roizmanbacteria bacterium]|nr:MFS transporter [Candidatus Roizmanbacteria bacterium]